MGLSSEHNEIGVQSYNSSIHAEAKSQKSFQTLFG